MGSPAGLLTRGSLFRRLPGPQASGVSAGERLPSQRRDRPGLAPGSLTVLRSRGRAYHAAVRAWLPVIVWAAVIFAFSSIPSLGTGLGTWDLVLRKLAHAAEYAVLGALLMRAVGREGPAWALGVLYAVTDEVHQHFVSGRQAAPLDVAVDALGVALGVLVWRAYGARNDAPRQAR
jgi:VanZ family protein